MATMSPKQQVEARFGTKGDLVKQITALTGGGDEEKRRLMGATNKKLLRIHAVATEAQDRFGGKAGVIDALATVTFPNGSPNAGWREKMDKRTVKRLLEDHRQRASR